MTDTHTYKHTTALLCLWLACMATPPQAAAQQATARGVSGNMELGHLIARVDTLSTQLAAQQALLAAHQRCTQQRKLYAPDSAGADENGCIQSGDIMCNWDNVPNYNLGIFGHFNKADKANRGVVILAGGCQGSAYVPRYESTQVVGHCEDGVLTKITRTTVSCGGAVCTQSQGQGAPCDR